MRPARTSRCPMRFSSWCLDDSAATTWPPRNEIVTVSSSPSTVRTPLFRWRPSTWKMSVSEKTRRVPSRPMGVPEGSQERARPHEEGRSPEKVDPGVLGGSRQLPRVEEAIADERHGGQEREDEEDGGAPEGPFRQEPVG